MKIDILLSNIERVLQCVILNPTSDCKDPSRLALEHDKIRGGGDQEG